MCYSSPYLHGLCVQDRLMQYCQDAVIQVETARTASGTTEKEPIASTIQHHRRTVLPGPTRGKVCASECGLRSHQRAHYGAIRLSDPDQDSQ